jgi:hypothetical protein
MLVSALTLLFRMGSVAPEMYGKAWPILMLWWSGWA